MSITVCAVDCINPILAARAINKTLVKLPYKYKKGILFTDQDTHEPIRSIKINRISSIHSYGLFIAGQLNKYIDTDYCLIVQWDGYATNSSLWSNDFLNYDYIGASWPQFTDCYDVGNGGFSLRSKRLIEATSKEKDLFDINMPEDLCLCRTNRQYFEKKYNLKFASRLAAQFFSHETGKTTNATFGFHGVFNIPSFENEKTTISIIEKINEHYFSNWRCSALLFECINAKYILAAEIIYKKISSKIEDYKIAEHLSFYRGITSQHSLDLCQDIRNLSLLRKKVHSFRSASLRTHNLIRGSFSRLKGPFMLDKSPVNVAVYGFFKSETGVGKAAREIANAINEEQIFNSLHNINIHHCENKIDFNCLNTIDNNKKNALLMFNADVLGRIYDVVDMKKIVKNKKIGFINWELPVFPGIWSKNLEILDEVWVPTKFVYDSLGSATNKPIKILPYPTQINDLNKISSRIDLRLPLDRLIFLTVFDFNSYPERKNPLGVIRAFIDAFPGNSQINPILVIKCHGVYNRESVLSEIKEKMSSNGNIILIDRVFEESMMAKLHASADVFISLHRAEGFGFNIIEAMASGKLVISTNFSGSTDFANEFNSIPISFKMKKLNVAEYPCYHGQWWADPDHDHAVEAIRLAARSEATRSDLGWAAKEAIRIKHNYKFIGSLARLYLT